MVKTKNIVNYLHGNCSKIEELRVEAWMVEDPENQRKFDELSVIYNGSNNIKDFITLDIDKEWHLMKEILDQNVQLTSSKKSKGKSKITSLYNYAAAAAALLILLTVGVVFNDLNHIQTKSIESGISDVTFNLHDGSNITLHENSSISFKSVFEGKREVKLDGSATFDVAKDETRPFMIVTEHTVTQVVGTSFTLSGVGKETTIKVHEGIVKFAAKDDFSNPITLKQGDEATYEIGQKVQKVIEEPIEEIKAPVIPVVKPAAKPVAKAEKIVEKPVVEEKPVVKIETPAPKSYGTISKYRLKDVVSLLSKKYKGKFKKNRKCKIDDADTVELNINDYGLPGVIEQLEIKYNLEFKENKKCNDCYELKSISKK